MNKYRMSKAGIDVAAALERFDNNEAIYLNLLKGFLADPNFGLLQTAMQDRDVEAAFAAAHAVKGISGNLNLDRLYENMVPLTERLRARTLDDETVALFETAQAAYQDVVTVLESAAL